MKLFKNFCLVLVFGFNFSNGYSKEIPFPQGFPFPSKLSEWNIFLKKDGGPFKLNKKVLPYFLKNPLFSDYSFKLRTLYIPKGKFAEIKGPFETLSFPLGTIISKTFAFGTEKVNLPSYENFEGQGHLKKLNGLKVVETRLLINTKKGWVGLPYVWEPSQKEAFLSPIGKTFSMEWLKGGTNPGQFKYKVPNMNQCKGCHLVQEDFSRTVLPIGPKPANLNLTHFYEAFQKPHNQLDLWKKRGWLKGFHGEGAAINFPVWDSPPSGNLEKRARAYLEINCGHCHHPKGPGASSGLFLNYEEKSSLRIGVCKSPVAVGNGGGGLPYAIFPGNPDQSYLYHRLHSTRPGVMMPELGRSLVHLEGARLIYQWISKMPGECQSED